MITIMGATGKTGGQIAGRLLDTGEKTRLFVRSADKVKDLAKRGAEVATGDATDARALAAAFRGADAVYTLLPPDIHAPDYPAFQARVREAILAALKESGVKHVVFLSSVGADLESGTGPIAGLAAHEKQLKALKGVNVLALRPGYFFENEYATLGLIKNQGINGGAMRPDVRIPMIATKDIADYAASALKKRDWKGFTVRELLGPRDMTFAEITRILGERLSKPDLKYVQFSYDDFTKALTEMGFSKSIAGLYAEMARAINEGKVKSLEGRRKENTTPTTFEEFADQLVPAYQAA